MEKIAYKLIDTIKSIHIKLIHFLANARWNKLYLN